MTCPRSCNQLGLGRAVSPVLGSFPRPVSPDVTISELALHAVAKAYCCAFVCWWPGPCLGIKARGVWREVFLSTGVF